MNSSAWYDSNINKGYKVEQQSEIYSSVSSRYASALISLANDQNCLNEIESDFTLISNLNDNEINFMKTFENPTISKNNKNLIINEILKVKPLNNYTLNFMKLIIENGRIVYLSNILKSFSKIISKIRGEIIVEIESPEEISEKNKKILIEDLQSRYKSNIKVLFRLNKDLISGSRIKIGSLMIDSSLKTKLNKITKNIQ